MPRKRRLRGRTVSLLACLLVSALAAWGVSTYMTAARWMMQDDDDDEARPVTMIISTPPRSFERDEECIRKWIHEHDASGFIPPISLPREPKVDPIDAIEILARCDASRRVTSIEFEALLHDAIRAKQCRAPPLSTPREAMCRLGCRLEEPDLERGVRLMKMAEHSLREVVDGCVKQRLFPFLVVIDWVNDASESGGVARVRWARCYSTRTERKRDERHERRSLSKRDDEEEANSFLFTPRYNLEDEDPPAALLASLKLIKSLTCLIDLTQQNKNVSPLAFGFDPYSRIGFFPQARRDIFQYLTPRVPTLKYSSPAAHPYLLFPHPEFVLDTLHCELLAGDDLDEGNVNRPGWWRICNTTDTPPSKVQHTNLFIWREEHHQHQGNDENNPSNKSRAKPRYANPEFLQRAQFVNKFKGNPRFDIGDNTDETHHYNRVGPFLIHMDDDYGVDFTLTRKLTHTDSLVFLVGSRHEYLHHYSALLRPWIHYVPVSPDFKELASSDWWWEEVDSARKMRDFIRGNLRTLFETRLRPQDTYCYVYRLLLSIRAAQSKKSESEEGTWSHGAALAELELFEVPLAS